MDTGIEQRVYVAVDDDFLKAWLSLGPSADAGELTREEIVAALEAARVVVDDACGQRIDQFLELVAAQAQQGEEPAGDQEQHPEKPVADQEQHAERFLIAEGQPMVEGENGRFIWEESLLRPEPEDEDAAIDYRTVNLIPTVEKEGVVGKIVPPDPGTAGADVHGNAQRPTRRVEPIKLQANVTLSDQDGETVIATEAGRVVLDGFKLGVRELLEIEGDVDFDSGNINATSEVYVRGNVRDLFEVKGKKTITIGGAVEAALVQADEDVIVHGGILGRFKGSVTAKGKIVAKFCDEANLRADGDIQLGSEAINSTVFTWATLLSERAAVIGGEAYARQGAEVHAIGSEACVPTRIAVGTHLSVFKKVQDIDTECRKQQEKVEKIRQMIQPLLAELKRLTSDQKETATQLLHQAGEIALQIKAKRKQQSELLEASRPAEPPYVTVTGKIYQNAVIIIDNREIHFHNDVKGPIRVEKCKVRNVTEVVAVNQLTASVETLNSAPCDLSKVADNEEVLLQVLALAPDDAPAQEDSAIPQGDAPAAPTAPEESHQS